MTKRLLDAHPPIKRGPKYQSKVLGPDASWVEKMEQIDKWISDMVTWGQRVRDDIRRIEIWLARTRQQEAHWDFQWNDPGDPPPKPWG